MNGSHQAQDIPGTCNCDDAWCDRKWAAHDAWVYPQWDDQHRFNSYVRKQLAWITGRIWFAMGLAAVGSFAGAAIATFIVQRMMGGD